MAKSEKFENLTIFAIFFLYMVYAIGTFINNDYLIAFTSPLITLLLVLLLVPQIKDLGPFKWSTVFMALGIFSWAFCDLVSIVMYFILGVEQLPLFIYMIYVLPHIFFALTMTVYMFGQLYKRKSDLLNFMTNTFCIAIIGFVLIHKIVLDTIGEIDSFLQYFQLLLFFLLFYTLTMVFQMFYLMGIKSIFKPTTITGYGVLFYTLLGLHYNYLSTIGEDPENKFTNLAFIFFMIMMGLGTTIQLRRRYDFKYQSWSYTRDAVLGRILYVIAAIIFDIAAMISGLLSQIEGFYILIVLIAYVLMAFILRSQMLSNELLDQKIKQNTILEERVLEKTKGLEKANEHLKFISSTDVLTGLYNRRYGWEYIKAAMAIATDRDTKVAIYSIDLNKFKPINDTYGHEMGDRVLEEFGKRLLALPEKFTAFRQGGDEFMVCCENITEKGEAEQEASMLQELFAKPIMYETYIFNLSASIGIAIFPDDSDDEESIIQYADAAMYTIKHSKNKNGYCFFDSKMVAIVSRKRKITERLKNASPDKEFVLYFQPQINFTEKTMTGIEAFPHLSGDMEHVSPSEIVPIAEEAGFMGKLGLWIMDQSMNYVNNWEKENGQKLSLTVNLSPLQLINADFVDDLEKLREKHGIEAGRVILDVANEVIMGAAGSAKESLKKLHEIGYRLSLNDFGGDDINLSYVLECHFDDIKLSRKLVSASNTKESALQLIKSILGIAGPMNINVIAVGIETTKEAELMKSMGITKMQGYLYGKPVRSDEFKDSVKDMHI